MNIEKVQRWIRPEVHALTPYHVPDARGLIKLDAMENPYSWPEDLMGEWLGVLSGVAVNRYPDPHAHALQAQLRATMNIPPAMDIVLGNGSDELIQMIAMAVSGPDRVILAPEPTFVMYRMIAAYTGMRYVGVPLRADFTLDVPAMLAAIELHQPAVVYLAYPNNPTGNMFNRGHIDAIIEKCPGLVVLDEAYHAFAGETYMQALGAPDNLLVMRTVSKMGLAGLRLGVLAGPPAWIREIDKVRLPYNINVLTQATAAYALQHMDVFNEQTRAIVGERERLLRDMQQVPGVLPYPSHANFILFRVPNGSAANIFNGLKSRGVLIKNMHRDGTPLANCLRVTVGARDENTKFVTALRQSCVVS